MDHNLEQMVSEFALDVEALQSATTQGNLDPDGIQRMFLALQQRFQTQLLATIASDGDRQAAVQPILTEMNRTLRLLGMDVAFLQTARQSMKVQQRQRQMGDRLFQLQTFCQGLQGHLGNPGA
ncbi:hypothetical protein C7271_05030 [filamentous cyanobacterium CCP5]|nr:hypothetical protein C7271_05030 [filamentous cyanobacterium CCP5]